jgi:hypothetical protein
VRVDLGDLGFDEGGHLVVKHALRQLAAGDELIVAGNAPGLFTHLRTWCRSEGHTFRPVGEFAGGAAREAIVGRSAAETQRWSGAQVAGRARSSEPQAVADHAQRRWGLAARGATVEAGAPEFGFTLVDKVEVWSVQAPRFYAQGAAAQWDPQTAVPWDADCNVPDDVEDAVVQIMTYLIENETAALMVPSRFIAQLHPHFREVMQVLALQAADEARHIEIFTRRAMLKRDRLGLSTGSGQASLKTLVEEPDYALAAFLLSVLGEGTFLNLLRFIETNAPDPITAAVARLAAQDEARHVAFGLAHIGEHLERDPGARAHLAAGVRRRHDTLQHTAGLNAEVFDALVILASGSWEHESIRRGFQRVAQLTRDMDEGRRKRLARLGFDEREATELSSLHTRNFM